MLLCSLTIFVVVVVVAAAAAAVVVVVGGVYVCMYVCMYVCVCVCLTNNLGFSSWLLFSGVWVSLDHSLLNIFVLTTVPQGMLHP